MKAPNPGLVPGVIPTHVTAFSGAKAAGRGKGTQVGLQTDEVCPRAADFTGGPSACT